MLRAKQVVGMLKLLDFAKPKSHVSKYISTDKVALVPDDQN